MTTNATQPNPKEEPFWKGLFSKGPFAWGFKMRSGDASSFFAQQDGSGGLLAEKSRWLDQSPELFMAWTPVGRELEEVAWNMARHWGSALPGDAVDDLDSDLSRLARRLEPDFLIMDHAGMTLAGGAVCFPSSWSLPHALGRPVQEVHGLVPGLNQQIGDKISRFLQTLAPGKSFCRENWGLTRTADLNYHPSLQRRALDEEVELNEVFLRVEHQLFIGIPGGVLMGIRIESCPISDLKSDPASWLTLAEKLQTMPNEVAEYKNLKKSRKRIVSLMDCFADD